MSLPAVLTAAEAAGAGMAGVLGHGQGQPIPDIPWSNTPYWVVNWDGTWTEAPITFGGTNGATRTIELRYGVRCTLILGAATMRQPDALALGAGFLDRVRAAFGTDISLGGACAGGGWAELQSGGHNLRDYTTQEATPPLLEWLLAVREYVTANAASAT